MPRKDRTVFSNIPHHITLRGNRREDVFFADEVREKYLKWLKEYCGKHRVEILAYCLMTNHVHLIAMPSILIDSSNGKVICGRGNTSRHR